MNGNKVPREPAAPIKQTKLACKAGSLNRLNVPFDGLLLLLAVSLLGESTWELIQTRSEFFTPALLLFANGVLATVGFLLAMIRGRPLFLAVFYFNFVFFSIGPLQQIQVLEDPIYESVDLVNLSIVLCITLSVSAILILLRPITALTKVKAKPGFLSTSIFSRAERPYALFLVAIGLNISLLFLYAPALFRTRQALSELLSSYFDKSIIILILSYLNPLCFIASLMGFLLARRLRSPMWTVAFAICLLMATAINNPFNMARFRLSTLACLLLLLYFGWRNTRVLVGYLLVGTFVSRALSAFRYDVFYHDAALARAGQRFFDSMDFHILNLFSYTIKYTENFGFSYGRNIASAFLFFIPRSIWEGKSEHVGFYILQFVKQYRYYGTDNLSSPLNAEGYFAFGGLGAILFPVFIFYLLSSIEGRAAAAERFSPWHFMVCCAPMLTMILMRGPLIVGVSEFFGTFGAIVTSALLLRFFTTRSRTSNVTIQMQLGSARPDRTLR